MDYAGEINDTVKQSLAASMVYPYNDDNTKQWFILAQGSQNVQSLPELTELQFLTSTSMYVWGSWQHAISNT